MTKTTNSGLDGLKITDEEKEKAISTPEEVEERAKLEGSIRLSGGFDEAKGAYVEGSVEIQF